MEGGRELQALWHLLEHNHGSYTTPQAARDGASKSQNTGAKLMSGVMCVVVWSESSLLPSTEICPFFFPFLSPLAAYPAAYGQISQAFPQPPPMIPQQQREGE